LTLVIGSRDNYVNAAMLAAEQARLDAASIPYDVITYDGGHAISRGQFARLAGTAAGESSGASDR
jgi:predicted esterase